MLVPSRPRRGTALGRAVDRIVEALAPVTAARRAQARRALQRAEQLSAFEGAKTSSAAWYSRAVSGGSADADLDEETLATLRERSRDRQRNDPIASACISALVDNVVGAGFRPKLRLDHRDLGITKAKATTLSHQASTIWEEWRETADATNRLDIEGLQSLIVGSALTSGDVFVQPLMVNDPRVRARYELKVSVIEGDRCDTPHGLRDDSVRNGVVIGSRGQPVAYWISEGHPGDDWIASSKAARSFRKIRAHAPSGRPNLLHVYAMERPGQSRGRPLLSTVLNTLKNREDMNEAVLVAAQVAACFAAFVTKPDPYGTAWDAAASDSKGKTPQHEDLYPGMIEYLNPGESVDFGTPGQPTGTFEPYLRAVTREITSALGMPYEIATRDFSGTTYSQARAALLEARRMFQRRQRWLVSSFLTPIWRMLLEEAWLKGDFGALDFADRPRAWTRTNWIPPGWGWIDPSKEAAAWREALDLGVTTRQAIISSNTGEDLADVTEQLAEEKELREAAGIATAPPAAPPTPAQSDDDDETPGAEDDAASATPAPETEEATT